MKRLVVALDGPAGSGKSTVAQRVAEALGATLLDTGAIYRSLAFEGRRLGVSWTDESALATLAAQMEIAFRLEDGLNHVLLGGRDISAEIRTPELSDGASAVSGLPDVRAALLQMQRDFAASGSVVAEGRDIGTVVFPEADVKVYLSADSKERARRRVDQLRAAGQAASYEDVHGAILARDKADSGREVAPLKRAEGAQDIDTTALSVDEVVQRIVRLCEGLGG